MISSTINTNHSSSFSTAKIIWRNRIWIGCPFHGWLFKDWPFDYHDSGTFRTGLGAGLAPAWVKAMTDSNWVSYRCQCIGCTSGVEAGWLWFGNLTTNLHFPSTLFCHISQIDNCRAWMMLSSFFCHWMFLNFLVLSPTITFDCDIFHSFRIFGCHYIAILFCMIISCAVSNSAEGGDVKSKSCLLFIINDQNIWMSNFVGLSCIQQNPSCI